MSPADVKVTQAHRERATETLRDISRVCGWDEDAMHPHINAIAAEFAAVEQAAFEAGAKAQREADVHVAREHREQAKQRQHDLPKQKDRVYGTGSVDAGEWERYQHGAGMAAVIAEAISAEPLVTLADVLAKGGGS